jgi:hypothetical protein
VNERHHILGLVLLLSIWGGATGVYLHCESEQEHHHLRTTAPQAVIACDRSALQQIATPRTHPDGTAASAMAARRQFRQGPTSLGTLLALRCLLLM